MLTKVNLEGKMRQIIGRDHLMLEFGTVDQMFGLIMANFPKVKHWLRKNIKNYKYFEVECTYPSGDKEKINDEGLSLSRVCKEVRVLPLFTGAGGKSAGVFQIILGVVVTAISIYANNPAGIAMGIGMMLGGIMTVLMAPSQDKNPEDDRVSYYFNGSVNTTRQGMPVPLVFGRTMVGSAVISASIDVTTDDNPSGKRIHYYDDGSK